MEDIRGLTVKNSKELDKYSVVFKQIGIENNTVIGSTFDIDKSLDSIIINNREHLIGYIFTPVENSVNANAIDIFLTTDLLKDKSIYTIANILIQLVSRNDTPTNRIVEIGVFIINETDFISVGLGTHIEQKRIFSIAGFLEYVKILIDKNMIKNIKSNGIIYFSSTENTDDLNVLLEEMLIGETNINNIE